MQYSEIPTETTVIIVPEDTERIDKKYICTLKTVKVHKHMLASWSLRQFQDSVISFVRH